MSANTPDVPPGGSLRADPQSPDVSRRIVLRGAALGGVALPLLVACGSDGGGAGASSATGDPTSADPPTGSETPSGTAEAPSGITTTADVPVGSGKILSDEQIVVTQPTEGEFKAFTAVCTHQACIVSEISDEQIVCGCHGSHYSIEDGSNLSGPAPSPLKEIAIKVEGDQIVRS